MPNTQPHQFTPGPWTARLEYLMTYIDAPNFPALATVQTRMSHQAVHHTEGKANARLIAAAPDLLEALEEMLDRYAPWGNGGTHERGQALDKAVRAIDKAKGPMPNAKCLTPSAELENTIGRGTLSNFEKTQLREHGTIH